MMFSLCTSGVCYRGVVYCVSDLCVCVCDDREQGGSDEVGRSGQGHCLSSGSYDQACKKWEEMEKL